MSEDRQQIADWIDEERARIVEFFRGFIRCKSPNPPGDTTEAARFIGDFLTREGLDHRFIAPQPQMPNVVASFVGAKPGRHLVLNGHIDVFPVGDGKDWTKDPWGGELVDGKIYGRGACDMKCGTSASVFTYAFLHRLRERLKGKLTLTAVSDEETFGPWGARYLMEHHPEVHGDCCLNGEPGSPYTIRFGEKGPLWLEFKIRTKGAHGAYTHASESATKLAQRLIADLEIVTEIKPQLSDNILRSLEAARASTDKAMGPGAADIVSKVTLNIGVIEGGLKVNMVPFACRFEADIRLPLGVTHEQVMAEVRKVLSRYPQASMEELNFNPPSYCPPDGAMVGILQKNVEAERGYRPQPIVSLGGTDARLWRYRDIPAYVYGPFPTGMGSADEHVDVEDFLHIVKVHALSAYDYLMTQ
ncbi:MAG TPA: ArgE/DapE family deacylase [Hypericibacter adhaerens]|jgi:succinyl-diaminopimelate desuccinylase|uniref:ArgE/DapE family deacylase n=1 Tax=Hypericibacter adhaerens TaxID=2602016 RepID=UPI002C7B885A|nr:ArgE/DapE family deacylase [Hypericibacter adhaerens]HWA45851.1 ArgE/DapE family deacylase [Hypericibacter adhaerens]